jgi:hypothetical protein
VIRCHRLASFPAISFTFTLRRVISRDFFLSPPSLHDQRTWRLSALTMMDPPTARLALKLQLDDVDAILKTLDSSSDDAATAGEIAAFKSLRNELIKKWQEVSGQHFAYSILKEENNNRFAFKRLLNEEQQAERTSCRIGSTHAAY